MDVSLESLQNALLDEICFAIGLPKTSWARRILGLPLGRATRRLSEIGLGFDRRCAEQGLPAAAEWALAHWCQGVRSRGAEAVPADGPLLVVSNHPGTYDALAIASCLGRPDLSIIVSDIPFLDGLPDARRHFIFLDIDGPARATAARQGLRHLKSGGALLLYGTGLIDPDPALSPEAPLEIDGWSRSIDLFIERVPGLSVLPCVVSHAMAPGWARSPLRRLRHTPLDQRRIVEFGQVIEQLLFPGRLMLSPRLSFGAPIAGADLRLRGDGRAAVIAAERALMVDHLRAFGGPDGL